MVWGKVFWCWAGDDEIVSGSGHVDVWEVEVGMWDVGVIWCRSRGMLASASWCLLIDVCMCDWCQNGVPFLLLGAGARVGDDDRFSLVSRGRQILLKLKISFPFLCQLGRKYFAMLEANGGLAPPSLHRRYPLGGPAQPSSCRIKPKLDRGKSQWG